MNSEYPRSHGFDLKCFKSDGTEVKVDPKNGVTLVSSNTYYFMVPCQRSNLVSVNFKWAAAVAGTLTVEDTNFPEYDGGASSSESDRTDVSDVSSTAGDWTQENPSTAIVAVTGSGNSSSAATVTIGGSAIGSAMFHLGNLGAARTRIKAVITTGGLVRCAGWGKGA